MLYSTGSEIGGSTMFDMLSGYLICGFLLEFVSEDDFGKSMSIGEDVM